MATILKEAVMIEGLTLSSVVWRKFRRQPPGFMEKVLAINPGLADQQEIPVGTEIAFPVEEIAVAKEDLKVVRLWGDD